ncbi:zinc finger protein [Colletotrichum incanum]|uniref:Zinc finger protein n=1 Tax=Colletotrichum incanum TaxID=1573173 RepID=A0A162MXQ6_COLIC|nr:zinc finger protein [Colletotrichum incanum]
MRPERQEKERFLPSLPLLDVSGALDSASHRRLLHNLNNGLQALSDYKRGKSAWPGSGPKYIELPPAFYKVASFTKPLPLLQRGSLGQLQGERRHNNNNNNNNNRLHRRRSDPRRSLQDNTEETCRKLQKAFQKAETQATIDASVFADENSQLTHFARAKSRNNAHTRVESQWEEAMHKKICEYPSPIMDSALKRK